jgi:uncharacterized protein (DUF1684 family)
MTPAEHRVQVEAWFRDRDARLRSPDGWLALVGLHWLEPGNNHFGSDPANEIVLHGSGVPPRAGTLHIDDSVVHLTPEADAGLMLDGAPTQPMRLADDADGEPTMLELGALRLHLIRRGDRMALRVRDHDAPALARFRGMDRFPTDPAWRVIGRLEPSKDETVEIVDVTGRVSQEPTRGAFAFERDGVAWRLTALAGDEEGTLWLIFGDATNARETYGGGRYLYTEPSAPDGTTVADFNLAYNPPCVFSAYATCPLPPAENRLNLRIEAGERMWRPAAD